ncbi:MAG: aldose 1-epimerase [Rhodopirellula sp.]|nr:aldose 1-epimerase [Rhodopirellula sp.]
MSNIVSIESADSDSTARISVDRGFNCFEFKADIDGRVVDVIDSQAGFADGAGRVSGNGIPLLFPFPNRIKGGNFSWAGKDYQLPADKVGYDNTGNAIHGLCIDRPWRIVAQGDDFVIGEFQLSEDAPDRLKLWPADFIIRVQYEISGATLQSKFEIFNPDKVVLPWGLGTHAYFKLPLTAETEADKCLCVAPVTEQWELIDCLPTGKKSALPSDVPLTDGVYFGERKLDDVFSGVPADIVECVIMDEAAGLQIAQRNPGSFTELVIYTPPNRNAICFEPYTCVTDAINLEQSEAAKQGLNTGWKTLGPGEMFSTWIDISAEQVLA